MGLENPLHLLLIAIVIVIVFGAKRLPELGRSLGRSYTQMLWMGLKMKAAYLPG